MGTWELSQPKLLPSMWIQQVQLEVIYCQVVLVIYCPGLLMSGSRRPLSGLGKWPLPPGSWFADFIFSFKKCATEEQNPNPYQKTVLEMRGNRQYEWLPLCMHIASKSQLSLPDWTISAYQLSLCQTPGTFYYAQQRSPSIATLWFSCNQNAFKFRQQFLLTQNVPECISILLVYPFFFFFFCYQDFIWPNSDPVSALVMASILDSQPLVMPRVPNPDICFAPWRFYTSHDVRQNSNIW